MSAFFEFDVISPNDLRQNGDEITREELGLGTVIVSGFVLVVYWIYSTLSIAFYGTECLKWSNHQVKYKT